MGSVLDAGDDGYVGSVLDAGDSGHVVEFTLGNMPMNMPMRMAENPGKLGLCAFSILLSSSFLTLRNNTKGFLPSGT